MKILLPALLLFFSASAGAQSSRAAPTLALKGIRGHQFNLRDYRGKVLLVNFWATWCQPCRTEIPDLIRKQSEYRGKGLQIIGITYPPEKMSEVRRFVRKLRMNYPVVMGTKETRTLFTSSETLPMTVVIDRDGVVRDVIEGIMYEDEFEQKVKPLLLKQARSLHSKPAFQNLRQCFGVSAITTSTLTSAQSLVFNIQRGAEQIVGRETLVKECSI
jgi:thiol-disulfide isomerase/thioredoxin